MATDARRKRVVAPLPEQLVEEEDVAEKSPLMQRIEKRAEGAIAEFKDWLRFVWDGEADCEGLRRVGQCFSPTRAGNKEQHVTELLEREKRVESGVLPLVKAMEEAVSVAESASRDLDTHTERTRTLATEALSRAQMAEKLLGKALVHLSELQEAYSSMEVGRSKAQQARQAMEEQLKDAQANEKLHKEALAGKDEEVERLRRELKDITKAREMADERASKFAECWEEEMRQRRSLQETVFALQGNIRILCRIKPPCSGNERKCIVASSMTGEVELENASADGRTQLSKFEFSYALDEKASQNDVYKTVSPLVGAFCDGADACVFAYGQTGSGKTHTMQGDLANEGQRGVFARALDDIFLHASTREAGGIPAYTVTVTMLEVYNDTVRDLLAPASASLLDVKMGGSRVRVPGATELAVEDAEQAMRALEEGKRRRATASTGMNADSSRSHMVLSVRLSGKSNNVLHLVDLAGSERVQRSGAEGTQLCEAQHINRSLSALGDVVAALQRQERHIPYRNSKLTSLLQEGLRPGSKVMMLVCVAPESCSARESLSTLGFAQRAQAVMLGSPDGKKRRPVST